LSGSSPPVRGSVTPMGYLRLRDRFIPARAGIGRPRSRPTRRAAVHPRPCGDRSVALIATTDLTGSSPPVRGSANLSHQLDDAGRFIPARAGIGSEAGESVTAKPLAVHPRPCGDRGSQPALRGPSVGSSPPVRGSAIWQSPTQPTRRFIPARAGIGWEPEPETYATSVHPRPCGDRRVTWHWHENPGGSSPPVRGSALTELLAGMDTRFIPARAGIGQLCQSGLRSPPVHPRPCGDRSSTKPRGLGVDGSSPPVRGSADVLHRLSPWRRFIPARAGIGGNMMLSTSWPTVHPRPCGDRLMANTELYSGTGSSPPVRGSVVYAMACCIEERFIPARAGIGCAISSTKSDVTVHPRPCGDRAPWLIYKAHSHGSSPPVRGSACQQRHFPHWIRFIPARAGIGILAWLRVPSGTVHPRPCGDRECQVAEIARRSGSSPPVRGSDYSLTRFIPARAGIGPPGSLPKSFPAVHPRPCGDRGRTSRGIQLTSGSSPPVRGSGEQRPVQTLRSRFIPARAGIGAAATSGGMPPSVHPRPCGDRPPRLILPFCVAGSSPPVRGSVSDATQGKRLRRFIPARAGIGCRCRSRVMRSPVHPRPCGDRTATACRMQGVHGSSPPVRGSDGNCVPHAGRTRFIPARAGIGHGQPTPPPACPVHPRPCGDRSATLTRRRRPTGSSPPVRGSDWL
ncbi:unnamed protein product, partial [Ectocarpus sp. 12 AP-2014]